METPYYEPSDDELIKGALQNDSRCLSVLYKRYFDIIYHQCQGYIHDNQAAFDLTQDIFLKAFLHLPSFQGKASFSSWLRTLGHNHCRDFLRKKKKYSFRSLDDKEFSSIRETREEIEQIDLLEDFSNLLESLSVEEKDLLISKYGKGVPIKVLQQRFNLSESAIKMRLSRAREKLLSLIHEKQPSWKNIKKKLN